MSADAILGGYVVHPAAAVFPLIEGDDFDYLVESICSNGIQHPIVVRRGPDADELLDGRNRLLAAEEAKRRGYRVEVPVTEWVDDGRNVAEWIWDTNAIRRQMTEDGWALASVAIAPLIEKENQARKAASKFDGSKAGPGRGKKTVTTKSCEPLKRDRKAEHARSTVGQVAAKAGTSMHKARQALAVQKAIDAGQLPAQAAKDVMAGKKKLRDVAPKPAPKPREPKHRTMRAILEDMRDLIAEWMNADHSPEALRDELNTYLERIGT